MHVFLPGIFTEKTKQIMCAYYHVNCCDFNPIDKPGAASLPYFPLIKSIETEFHLFPFIISFSIRVKNISLIYSKISCKK